MDDDYLSSVILFGHDSSVYKGIPIPVEHFLKTYLPKVIQEFLKYVWSMDECVCIAGSSPGFLIGKLKAFNDIDVFMTTSVLR